MILSRSAILAAADIQTETVAVPQWGGEVLVRGLSGLERDAFEASIIRGKGKSAEVNLQNLRAKLVAASVIGEDGKHLFAEADVEALGRKSAAALQRVFEVAQRLSGLSPEDVEELTKNSGSGQSDGVISN